MGTALMRFGVRQHARAEPIAKRAPWRNVAVERTGACRSLSNCMHTSFKRLYSFRRELCAALSVMAQRCARRTPIFGDTPAVVPSLDRSELARQGSVDEIFGNRGEVSGSPTHIDLRWWAHLVGALRVYPHEHYANFSLRPFDAALATETGSPPRAGGYRS